MTKALDNPNLKLVLESHAQWLNGTGGKCANLIGADLTWATMTGATMTGADLTGADLTRADLTGADLNYATMTDATMTDATMTDATMTDATMTDATMTDATMTDAYGNVWTAEGKATTWNSSFTASTVRAADGQRRFRYGCEGWRTIVEWEQDVASLCQKHMPDEAADYEAEILDLLDKCRGMDK